MGPTRLTRPPASTPAHLCPPGAPRPAALPPASALAAVHPFGGRTGRDTIFSRMDRPLPHPGGWPLLMQPREVPV